MLIKKTACQSEGGGGGSKIISLGGSRLIAQPPGTIGESNAIAFSDVLGGDIRVG